MKSRWAIRFLCGIAIALTAWGNAHAEAPRSERSWQDRLLFSGNADTHFAYGQERSAAPEGRFALDNGRFFFDVDLTPDPVGVQPLFFDEASVFFEWDLVREAEVKNKVGAFYLRMDELFGASALNLKMGRMPIAFGEEYLRFSEERYDNPLISFSSPSPYGWDEGIMLFGSFLDNLFSYRLSVHDGDNDISTNISFFC